MIERARHPRTQIGDRYEPTRRFVNKEMKQGVICGRDTAAKLGLDRSRWIPVDQFSRQG